jgi:hypothetical protein
MALGGVDRGIIVRPDARSVMRVHRPVVWLVLQDVALDAEWREGRLVAPTSARLVAEHLQLDPGTVASALRTLRATGLVELAQTSGPAGRFGLAIYTVHLPEGIEALTPSLVAPHPEIPHAVQPRTGRVEVDAGLVLTCPWDGGPPSSSLPRDGASATAPHAVEPRLVGPGSSTSARHRAARRSVEQGAFDLGTDV